jgi:hypothetical protein
MLGSVPSNPDGSPALLSPVECDLNDWGFTYGVAWAAAKQRHPDEPDERVAERALGAARSVFNDYCADEDWSGGLGERVRARETTGTR